MLAVAIGASGNFQTILKNKIEIKLIFFSCRSHNYHSHPNLFDHVESKMAARAQKCDDRFSSVWLFEWKCAKASRTTHGQCALSDRSRGENSMGSNSGRYGSVESLRNRTGDWHKANFLHVHRLSSFQRKYNANSLQ